MQQPIDKNSLIHKRALIELKIPQLGEGLQETRITRLLKQVGDYINEDEVIYEMETEKSKSSVTPNKKNMHNKSKSKSKSKSKLINTKKNTK